jgi:hypothetical protein
VLHQIGDVPVTHVERDEMDAFLIERVVALAEVFAIEHTAVERFSFLK